MILKRDLLAKVVSGEVRAVFRRWVRPSVRAGGTLKTALGVLAIDSVEVVPTSAITEKDARSAGYAGRSELLAELNERDGELYRIELHYAGEDPRMALRERDQLSEDELSELVQRLDRFDGASRSGPWTRATLSLIARRPATLAAKLARELGQEALSFKRNVRKLKELGLTESLEVGYRLSPRGQAFIDTLLAR